MTCYNFIRVFSKLPFWMLKRCLEQGWAKNLQCFYAIQVKRPSLHLSSFKQFPFNSSASWWCFHCPGEMLRSTWEPLGTEPFSEFMCLLGTLKATDGWCAEKVALKFPFWEALSSWHSSYMLPGNKGPDISRVYSWRKKNRNLLVKWS